MESPATALLDPPQLQPRQKFTTPFALVFGMVLTLAVSGYQFGRGNLTVYLLDGLRLVHPELLRNDWFVTQTLQYHACFSMLTAGLMSLHLLEPGFLVGYLALIILWHVFWRRLVIELGGDDRIYLISVFLFYLSAAGISVGVFQFLQDGCFLPSNVASVAMLGGIVNWIGGRRIAAGVWFGIAGLFHVNYAALAVGLWPCLLAWDALDRYPNLPWLLLIPRPLRGSLPPLRPRRAIGQNLLASALALLPSLLNIGFALPDELRRGGTMPMADFVAVYVRFRHTHHFDPLHWPAVLWISFLWPIPLAIWAAARSSAGEPCQPARREACRIFTLLAGLQVVAFLFAGVWFLNEPLVQLCLWRFSIFIKLMSCVGAAFIFCNPQLLGHISLSRIIRLIAAVAVLGYAGFLIFDPAQRGPVWRMASEHRAGIGLVIGLWVVLAIEQSLQKGEGFRKIATVALPIIVLIAWPVIGVGMTPEPVDPEYREVCLWAKDPANTPLDAIFLVPPQETDFRLYAQRAIVVNFKHVPQLSGEIVQWERRLLDVLGVPNVGVFPHDYTQTLAAIESTYEDRSPAALISVARKYGARYIVVDHSLGPELAGAIAFHHANNRYFVYDPASLTTEP
jgi:hypothetical protein